jgi:hypothetical protein
MKASEDNGRPGRSPEGRMVTVGAIGHVRRQFDASLLRAGGTYV